MYKLTIGGVIHPQGFFIPDNPLNADWQDYLIWLGQDNQPLPADVPTAEQIAKEAEETQATPTARQWLIEHPSAISFIRLTAAQQAAAIDGYTLAQLKETVKALAIVVSAIVKREML